MIERFNLSMVKGGGGKITPQANLLAAISEPHGTIQNALVTFPRYGWATKWHNCGIYIVIQKSKMAAESASNFLKKFEKPITRIVCKITAQFQRLYPHFLGLEIHWSNYLYCMLRAEVINPRWRLRKMKYLYLSKYTI